jgi:hypothetical protein
MQEIVPTCASDWFAMKKTNRRTETTKNPFHLLRPMMLSSLKLIQIEIYQTMVQQLNQLNPVFLSCKRCIFTLNAASVICPQK